MSDVQIENHEAEHRYEAKVDGELAGFAEYRLENERNLVVFTHTVVDDAFEGQGVGSSLVRDALADVRGRGAKVVAECSFVKSWIKRHPDHQDLLA